QHKRPITGHANLLVRFPEMPVLFDQFAALCARYLPVGSGPSGIMKRTQSSHSGPCVTLFAFLGLPKAFQTHLLSAVRRISFQDVLAAFKACCSIFLRLP